MGTPTAKETFPVSEEDVRASLSRVLGDERGQEVWLEACEAARVPRSDTDLGPDEITQVIEHLKQRDGAASVVGNSLSVKVRTHEHRPT